MGRAHDQHIRRVQNAEQRAVLPVENPHAVLAERDGTGYTPHFARVSLPEGTPAGSVITVSPTRFENGLLQ